MKLDYTFRNSELLQTALTHPSMSKDRDIKNYEKLEFLGDNVLNLMLAEVLYHEFPDFEEGRLSQVHANLVKTQTLALIAASVGLGHVMILDKGEEASGGRHNTKNLENCLEALIGAVFLDSSYQTVKQVFLPHWQPYILNRDYALQRDAKSLLQEWAQKHKLGLPKYVLVEEKGQAHSKEFVVRVEVKGHAPVSGKGSSIKKAEVEAAQYFIKDHGVQNE